MALFAARYAKAFADVVAEFHLGAPAVDKQLQDFLAAWDESPDLREVFGDPSVPVAQKVAVIDGLKTKLHLAPQVRNLLGITFEKTDAPSGMVFLNFGDGAIVRLDVECLEAELADIGPRRAACDCEGHTLTIASADEAM